jgi:replication factor C subunit 3/5
MKLLMRNSKCTLYPLLSTIYYATQHSLLLYSVNADNSGKQALLSLAQGDMRRVLNLLQSTALAYNQEVSAETVYTTAGAASPHIIQEIFQSLLTDTFMIACNKLTQVSGLLSTLYYFTHDIN